MPTGWREDGCVAFHGVELPYVFGYVPDGLDVPTLRFLARRSGCTSPEPGADAADQIVAYQVMTMWARFAATGDPSVAGVVSWPPYTRSGTKGGDRYLDIGQALEVRKGIRSAYRAPAVQPATE
jgi:para-nitrobenzyl esterase